MPASIGVLSRLIENAPVGIAVWRLADRSDDTSLELLVANAATQRYLAKDLSDELGKRFSDVFPAIPPERRKVYADVVRTGERLQTLETSNVSGVDEVYSIDAIALGDDCVGVFLEHLGGQRRAEAIAVEANRFLDSIIENLPTMIFVKEAKELRFERFNKAGEELLSMSRAQLLGKSD